MYTRYVSGLHSYLLVTSGDLAIPTRFHGPSLSTRSTHSSVIADLTTDNQLFLMLLQECVRNGIKY